MDTQVNSLEKCECVATYIASESTDPVEWQECESIQSEVLAEKAPPQDSMAQMSRTLVAVYALELEIMRSPAAERLFGEAVVQSVPIKGGLQSLTDSTFIVADRAITIALHVRTTAIAVTLSNEGSESLKLLWNEAAFVGVDGVSTRVMHDGIKFSERNGIHAPAIVIAGSNISDVAVPNDKVFKTETTWLSADLLPHSYQPTELCPTRICTETVLRKNSKSLIGKSIGLLLPLEVAGVRHEYMFKFAIADVQLKELEGSVPEPDGGNG